MWFSTRPVPLTPQQASLARDNRIQYLATAPRASFDMQVELEGLIKEKADAERKN